MNFLKENWFKVGILVALFGIAYLFYPEEQVITGNQIIELSQALKASFDEASQRSAMADIAELSCFPTRRYDCSSDGCTSFAPATYYFVDYGLEGGTYFRCDTKGCDNYPVKVIPSGSFTQFIPSQGQAMLFKVGNDPLTNKGEFVDIATLGTMTILSFGKCNQ
jgi:hypothetical protein